MTRARRGWRRPSNPKGGFSPDDAGECVQGLRGAQASKRLPAPHRLRVAGEPRPGEGLGCLQGLGASTLLEAGRGEEGARQSEAGRGPVRWLTALWSKAGSGHAPAAPLRGGSSSAGWACLMPLRQRRGCVCCSPSAAWKVAWLRRRWRPALRPRAPAGARGRLG